MTPTFAVEGRLDALTPEAERLLLERGQTIAETVSARVAALIDDVRRNGDAALRRFAREFDGVDLDSVEIPAGAARAALAGLDAGVRSALELARDAIEVFHRAQLPKPLELEMRPGVRLGRRPDPLRSIGVYAPGGRASYPSSVLMGAVPAKVAGVANLMVATPPGPDGRPSTAVLAACALAGVDRVFVMGGAGAVAAFAFGTETVPRADRVIGPGNTFVTEAKRQLAGVVSMDCPAGPSELIVIADHSADPTLVAAELIAQAEHDPDAAVALVACDAGLLEATRASIAVLSDAQPRRDIILRALAAHGALLLAVDLDEALRFAERYAPEHLMLAVRSPHECLDRVRAAGTVFIGTQSSVVFGDYVTGANHVLPTAGLARGYSGLGTTDFFRWTTWQEVSGTAAGDLAESAGTLARVEGLHGHALAAHLRASARRADERNGRSASAGTAVTHEDPGDVAEIRFRPAYRELSPYDPGRIPCPVDLSDNTNLFGICPSAERVLHALPSSAVTRYPTVYATPLKRALAERFGVEVSNVATGCGSDDLIDSAIRAFCETGDALAFPWPTFGVVPMFAGMNAVGSAAVPLRAGFALDVDGLLRVDARVTYVCRPNNPTGNTFERAHIERLARETRGVLLIDEAYADFADDDLIDLAVSSDRVVVLRTLSKAWGMAGLRIGFAIGAAPLIAEIEKSRGPYKVNGLAESAATRALLEDDAWVRAGIAEVRENRVRLAAALAPFGLTPLASAANFLLVPVPASLGTARSITDGLRARGVAVRPFPALDGASDCIRVTIGPWRMMQAFLDVLSDVLDGARAPTAGAEP